MSIKLCPISQNYGSCYIKEHPNKPKLGFGNFIIEKPCICETKNLQNWESEDIDPRGLNDDGGQFIKTPEGRVIKQLYALKEKDKLVESIKYDQLTDENFRPFSSFYNVKGKTPEDENTLIEKIRQCGISVKIKGKGNTANVEEIFAPLFDKQA